MGGGGGLPQKYGQSTGNSAKYCTSKKGVKYFEVRVLFNNHVQDVRELDTKRVRPQLRKLWELG